MERNRLADKLDGLSIQEQLELLINSLSDARNKLEIANLLWDRVAAAEDFLHDDELSLLDSGAKVVVAIRSLVGCPEKKPRKRRRK